MSGDATKEKRPPATNWQDPVLMEAILIQILAIGIEAFLTHKANVKANTTLGVSAKTYSQKDAWTEEPDGIIPCLKRHL